VGDLFWNSHSHLASSLGVDIHTQDKDLHDHQNLLHMALEPIEHTHAKADIGKAARSHPEAGRFPPGSPAYGRSFRLVALSSKRDLIGLPQSGQAVYVDSHSCGTNTNCDAKSVRDADSYEDYSGSQHNDKAVHLGGGYLNADPAADKPRYVHIATTRPDKDAGSDQSLDVVHWHYPRIRHVIPGGRPCNPTQDRHRKRRRDPFPCAV
jgi:hypothetical protein